MAPPTVFQQGGGDPFRRDAQIIAHGQSGFNVPGGWLKSTFTQSLENVNVRRPGIPVAKFMLPAGASDQYVETKIKLPPTALLGRIDLQIYLPPLTAGSVYMELRYSSDTPAADPPNANPANRRFMNILPDQNTRGKWSTITIDKAGKLYSNGTPNGTAWVDTGTPDPAEIEYLAIVLGCTAATPDAERYFLLDTVSINGYRKPFIMLGADGFGTPSHSSQLYPLLSSRGFKGYIAGDGNLAAGAAGFLNTVYAAGWDVLSQGMDHKNYANNSSALPDDYDTARGILDGMGFTRASKWFAYPVGGISQATIATLDSKGVKAARASNHPKITISELGNTDFTQTGSFDFGLRTSTQMRAWLDDILLSGEGMMMYVHDLVTTPTLSTETSIASFTIFLDYLKTKVDAGLIDVITPQEFLNRNGL